MSSLVDVAAAWRDWALAATWQLALLVVLIAGLTSAWRGSSAQLRYGLWLLVLVKALSPPSLTAVWGVGAWVVAPIVQWSSPDSPQGAVVASGGEGINQDVNVQDSPPRGAVQIEAPADEVLLVVWAAACLWLWLAVGVRYWRLMRSTRTMRHVDEGPARVVVEQLAEQLSIAHAPELYAVDREMSPLLIGVWRPKIIIPQSILDHFDAVELRMILAHELMHWRRRDTWVGWVQVFVQGLFWFHPLVWLANAHIRHERECACDEAVLRRARCDRDGYGQTILRVLTAARGRSLATANMAGVFERGSHVQNRLEEIMSFESGQRTFGWLSRGALVVAALVLLPMAAPAQQDEPSEDAVSAEGDSGARAEVAAEAESEQPAKRRTDWPTIASSTPKVGAANVDPTLEEVSVTFDRDMDAGGFSWTGGGDAYPPTPEGKSPYWKDKRTCVLPVELKRGSFYRVGINSSSHQNFRGADGAAAETAAIYFATRGASRGTVARMRVPKVVNTMPDFDATDVDPRLSLISVTFDVAMDVNGFSWTGGGPTFPTIPDGERPRWSRDGKTCTLPVKLAPGVRYDVGLNSVSHKNFASRWGVPLEPVRLQFSTADERAGGDEDASAGQTPRVVKMTPENGATDVDPSLASVRVTFDRRMADGFSWTGGGENFPTIPEGQRPRWSRDKKTCILPVELKPNWQYRLGLNSPSFKKFASAEGTPLEPVAYEFRTGAGDE